MAVRGAWAKFNPYPRHAYPMRATSRLDRRGRVTIRHEYRRIFRERVVQILTPHGLLLRPVPDTLPDRGRLPPALTASGEEEAEREAGA